MSKRSIVNGRWRVLLAVVAFTILFAPSAAPSAELPEPVPPAVEVRHLRGFKVLVPTSDAGELADLTGRERTRLVEVDVSEFTDLMGRNNRLLAELRRLALAREAAARGERPLPADCLFSKAAYRFVKAGAVIGCEAEFDFTILNDRRHVLVPLVGGRIAVREVALDDARGGRTPGMPSDQGTAGTEGSVPVLLVEPSPAGDPVGGSRYTLAVKGAGEYRLRLGWSIEPETGDAVETVRLGVPNSPENSILYLCDADRSVIRMQPSTGLRQFADPRTGHQAMEARFGPTDAITISRRRAEDGETVPAGAETPADPEIAGEEIPGIPLEDPTVGTVAPRAGSAGARPVFKCEVDAQFSFGEEAVYGIHELRFRVIKGRVDRLSIDLPSGTVIEEVLSSNFDKCLVREFAGHASVEVLFRTPFERDFSIGLKTVTALAAGARRFDLPELTVREVESERGHIAICAVANIRVSLDGDPVDLERIDAFELPEHMRHAVVSPILFAFKYHRHPHRAGFALTRYADADLLATIVDRTVIETVVTTGGRALSDIAMDVKNNGLQMLKLIPAGTAEVLETRVASRPAKVSLDADGNFRIPLAQSAMSDGGVADFPVNVKVSVATAPLSDRWGSLKVRMPRIEIPVMSFEWRVFVPDGFVFFDLNGAPGLRQDAPDPVVYQIPVNLAAAVGRLAHAEDIAPFLIFILPVCFLIFLACSLRFGAGETLAVAARLVALGGRAVAAVFLTARDHLIRGFAAIMILLLVAHLAMPQFSSMTEDSRLTKARQDCDTLAQAIQKYNTLEDRRIEKLMDLKGKYLTNIDTLHDPWGSVYQIEARQGFVYSCGPDRKPGTQDDIRIRFAPEKTGPAEPPLYGGEAATERASRKGIFSVPVSLVRTGTSRTLNKKFVMPGQDIHLDISYLTTGAFRCLAGGLILLGLLFPFLAGSALRRGPGFARKGLGALAVVLIIEAANARIPQTAYHAQLGMLCGALLLLLAWCARSLADPAVRRKLAAALLPGDGDGAPADPEKPEPPRGGLPPTIALLAIGLSAMLANASPAGAAGEATREIRFNPATLEIQLFIPAAADRRTAPSAPERAFVNYADLRHLLDSLRTVERSGAEIVFPLPPVPKAGLPFRYAVERIALGGSAGLEVADLTLDYAIEVFGEGYCKVGLLSGEVALTGVRATAQDRPAGPAGDRILNMMPDGRAYVAVFDRPGRYLVRLSFRADLLAGPDGPAFELSLPPCPRIEAEIGTPAGYDLEAAGLIIRSRSSAPDGTGITTAGDLVPAESYRFRLALQEHMRDRLSLERAAAEAREARRREEVRRSAETRLVAIKDEPRIGVKIDQILTVDDGRLSASSEFRYEISNRTVRDLLFRVPSAALVTRVEPADEIHDWKVEAASPGEPDGTLSVSLKTPRRGRFAIRLGFERAMPDRRREVEAPIVLPLDADERELTLSLDSAVNAEIFVTTSENLIRVDARGAAAGKASPPVLYSFKTAKFPASLSIEVRKNAELPSIPCAIDRALYRTFVTKSGYALTTARYVVRNNNVQFLEAILPEGSTPWSLRVGERLVKPARDERGALFIPLLKSPLVDDRFQAFGVELVYMSKMPEFGDRGGARFETPRIATICSKIDWEFHFMGDYTLSGLRTNLRRAPATGEAGAFDPDAGRALSVDQILALQKRMKAANAATDETGAALTAAGKPDGDGNPASLLQFGGRARGFLPVSAEFPELATKALRMTGENLKVPDGIDKGPVHYIEFSYRSDRFVDRIAFAGYLFGILLAFGLARAFFRSRGYRNILILGVLVYAYALTLSVYSGNSLNYLHAGLFMGALLLLLGPLAGAGAAKPPDRAPDRT